MEGGNLQGIVSIVLCTYWEAKGGETAKHV